MRPLLLHRVLFPAVIYLFPRHLWCLILDVPMHSSSSPPWSVRASYWPVIFFLSLDLPKVFEFNLSSPLGNVCTFLSLLLLPSSDCSVLVHLFLLLFRRNNHSFSIMLFFFRRPFPLSSPFLQVKWVSPRVSFCFVRWQITSMSGSSIIAIFEFFHPHGQCSYHFL